MCISKSFNNANSHYNIKLFKHVDMFMLHPSAFSDASLNLFPDTLPGTTSWQGSVFGVCLRGLWAVSSCTQWAWGSLDRKRSCISICLRWSVWLLILALRPSLCFILTWDLMEMAVGRASLPPEHKHPLGKPLNLLMKSRCLDQLAYGGGSYQHKG